MQDSTIWQISPPQEYPALRGRLTADAAIVGGGFTGLACALWLSRAGLSVVVLEANRLGYGASSHCAGIVSLLGGPHYAALEQRMGAQSTLCYVQTQQSALRALRQMAREGAFEWQEADAFLCASKADQPLLDKEARAAQKAGIPTEQQPAPQGLSGLDECLRLPGMGLLHPLRYLSFLAQEAEKRGARIYEHSPVVSVETNAVYTQTASVQAPYLIIATGYPIVNIPGWYFLHMEQREGRILPLKGRTFHHAFYASFSDGWVARPLGDGALAHCHAASVGSRRNSSMLDAAAAAAASALDMEALPGVSGVECCTPDGLPFIGPYGRKTPNLFVAAGYGGNGILGSLTAAQAISAHVLGLPSQGYEVYSPRRTAHDFQTPLHIGSRYAMEWLRKPSAPRCPHLGCKLVFNPHSRIWECPCHGSRFDDIGHILNAPAVREAQLRRRG